MGKIKSYIIAHKIISGVVLITVLFSGYWTYKKFTSVSGETRYVISKVKKGTIIASISGSGQVTNVNQIDLKSKVSGDVIYLGAKNGDKINSGGLILEVDPKDAQKAVRDAETNLTSAKLSLQKLQIQNSDDNINATSLKAYNDSFDALSATFYDLNSTLTGIDNMLASNSLGDNAARASGNIAQAYRDKAKNAYYDAHTAFEQNAINYGTINSKSSKTDIKNILEETYETTKLVSDTIKSTVNFVNYMAEDPRNSSSLTTYQNTLDTYTTTINTHLASLLAAKTSINNSSDSAQNATIDIQNAELSVTQKENSLQDAKDKLADYFIRAPYTGTLANFDIKKLDSISSGAIVGTLVTTKQLALISLNEVDVAKVKVGEKATLTFDAIPDLTISGVVTEINSIGVVSQGVVTYDVKIDFDTEDDRVKPAMSVSAAITTDMKQDVLVVPNSAVKSQAGTSYVEKFEMPGATPANGPIGSISKIKPNKIPVEVGLSNDSETEIISGIKEGDEIVTRTILPTSTGTQAAPSIFGGAGTRTTGGGTNRTIGR